MTITADTPVTTASVELELDTVEEVIADIACEGASFCAMVILSLRAISAL